jgi:hypothetical protein
VYGNERLKFLKSPRRAYTEGVKLPLIAFAGFGLLMSACQSEGRREADRRRAEQDRNSAAFKAGEAAHKIANEAERAAAAAGRKLDEGARKAHEGWKEQERKDRDRP